EGSYRFLIGLGKKVILANQFSEIANQFLQSGFSQLTTMGAWVGIVAFTFQIFFDFSGYSDMAIGLGRCLGFHFAENFKHPYVCTSITDFWRKWHISLGSFFRDYVYIPMGGNRHHQVLNILVVWFLTGMWHGASWNFILWGIYFGIIVTLEKYTLLKVINKIPKVFLHVYSLVLVVIGWGIFYFTNLTQMQRFFQVFFGQTDKIVDFAAQTAFFNNFWLWIAGIIFSMPVYDFVNKHFSKIKSETIHANVALVTRIAISLCLLFLSVALLVGATNNAFIYTRF
ncbi:MBOAT family O-acyltransferase, partial [Prevotella nigrescens]